MSFTKLDQAGLDSPRQEFSNGGLGIVVALLVCLGIDFFVCVLLIDNPAVEERTRPVLLHFLFPRRRCRPEEEGGPA